MNLQKIQQYISEYKNYLKTTRDYREDHKWESLKNFQDNWDIEAADFGKMYDASLQNSQTRTLWKGDNFFPKEMMMKFIQSSPDFVRNMFRDLFDESKSIENRITRFQFCCDSLLGEYKEKKPLSIENNHFHHENHIISMYLGFRFPQQYTLFQFPYFKKTMEKFGSTKTVTPYDFERFFKVVRTLNNFIQKEPEVALFQKKKLIPSLHYMDDTLLLVNDFYCFVGHR